MISVNGSRDPGMVSLVSPQGKVTDLLTVYFNGKLVWEQYYGASDVEAGKGIDLTVSLDSGGASLSIENATYTGIDNDVYYMDTGYQGQWYLADMVLEFPLEKGAQLGVWGDAVSDASAYLGRIECDGRLRGMPDGYDLYEVKMAAERTIGLGCFELSGSGVIDDRLGTGSFPVSFRNLQTLQDGQRLTGLELIANLEDMPSAIRAKASTPYIAVVNDLVSGWIYQGKCEILLVHPVSGDSFHQ